MSPFDLPEYAARPPSSDDDPITDTQLLIYRRDWQRMYDFATRHRLGDSATTLRCLLDMADAHDAVAAQLRRCELSGQRRLGDQRQDGA